MHEPIEFRAQAAYIEVQKDNGTITLWRSENCLENVLNGAMNLANHLSDSRALPLNDSWKLLEDFSSNHNLRVLRPNGWKQTPRLIRIYGNEGHELVSPRFQPQINFCFRQHDLKDCVLIIQANHLWIWSDSTQPVTTFALRTANKFWFDRMGQSIQDENAIVISEGCEPDEFKALFPFWKESSPPEEPCPPRLLTELLHERTKPRTIEELKLRNLPKGCDTKHLERYLTDPDFLATFGFTKEEYEALPRWRQILLKKEANLF